MTTTLLRSMTATTVVLLLAVGCGKQAAETPTAATEAAPATEPASHATSQPTLEAAAEPTVDGLMPTGEGFVWHPQGSEGRLLVVLPDRYVESVVRCTIDKKIDNGWEEVEQGVPHIELGGQIRARFRFSQSGSSYAMPSYVAAHLSDGSVVRWEISAPSDKHGDMTDVIAAEAAAMAMDHPNDPHAADAMRTVSLDDYDVRTPDGGFAWQPGASRDDRLVVYLPPQLKGLVEACSVAVLGPNDWVPLDVGELRVEAGAPRDMFVFPHGGAFYPNHCHVVAKLNDDQIIAWEIRGSERAHP